MNCNSNNISFGPRDKEFVGIGLGVLCPLTHPLSYFPTLIEAPYNQNKNSNRDLELGSEILS